MNKKIEDASYRICELGCDLVNEYILLLEKGIDHEIFNDLSDEERQILCRELISIMSVYE